MSHYDDMREDETIRRAGKWHVPDSYWENLHAKFPDEEPRIDIIKEGNVVEIEDKGGAEGLRKALKRQAVREAAIYTNDVQKSLEAHTDANKYMREIKKGVFVDVYDVLLSFDVRCPATQHAIKKLLCAGQRGIKGYTEDLSEAIESIQRAIELNTGEKYEEN